MAGIRINIHDLIAPSAAGQLTVGFGRLPVSYQVRGVPLTSLKALLFPLPILAFFLQGYTMRQISLLGVPDTHLRAYAIATVLLAFLVGPAINLLVAFIRTRKVTVFDHQVVIEFPNNPFAQSRSALLSTYRGVTRRWGERRSGKRTIKQEIIELFHNDPNLSVPVRITEDYETPEEDIRDLALQIGVDHLVSSYKKPRPLPQSTPAKSPWVEPRMTVPDASFNQFQPPSDIDLTRPGDSNNRTGQTRITEKTLFDPAWGRRFGVCLSALLFGYGLISPDRILVFISAIWFLVASWRLVFGKRGFRAISIDRQHVVFEKDRDALVRRYTADETRRIAKAEITDVLVRRRDDGRRDELVVQERGRETAADFKLQRAALDWVRDYLVSEIRSGR